MPSTVLRSLTGLGPADEFVALLTDISGRPAPAGLRRQRSQLLDAMLDGHFQFGGRRVAIAADPDLLFAQAQFFAAMGADIVAAVASTPNAPHLADIPAARVLVGDLMDLEDLARDAGAELLVTHSHGRQAAERLHIPLAAHRLSGVRPARRAASLHGRLSRHPRPDFRGGQHGARRHARARTR